MTTIIIAFYIISILVFAIWTRQSNSFSSYTIGNKEVSLLLLFPSLCATFIGPGYSLGFIRNGSEIGLLFFLYASGYGVQTMLSGAFLAPRIQQMNNVYSLGDIINFRFGRISQLLVGALSITLLTAFISIMAKIGGETLSSITNLEPNHSIILITSFVALYSLFGGIKSSISTDVLQFGIFLILFVLLFLFVFFKSDIQFSQVTNQSWDLGLDAANNKYSYFEILSLFISFALGEALVPPYINRALSSKDASTAKKSFIYSGIFFLFWLLLMIILGVYSNLLIEDAATDTGGLTLSKMFFPDYLHLIMIVSIIGIVMSTQDSLLNSASTSFVQDIIHVFLKVNEKASLRLTRVFTLVIAGMAIYFAGFVDNVIESLLWCYKFWAPCIVPILVFSVFTKKRFFYAGFISISIAFGSTLLLELTKLSDPEITLFSTTISAISLLLFTTAEQKLKRT